MVGSSIAAATQAARSPGNPAQPRKLHRQSLRACSDQAAAEHASVSHAVTISALREGSDPSSSQGDSAATAWELRSGTCAAGTVRGLNQGASWRTSAAVTTIFSMRRFCSQCSSARAKQPGLPQVNNSVLVCWPVFVESSASTHSTSLSVVLSPPLLVVRRC